MSFVQQIIGKIILMRISDKVDGAQCYYKKDSKHFPNWTFPEQLLKIVCTWLPLEKRFLSSWHMKFPFGTEFGQRDKMSFSIMGFAFYIIYSSNSKHKRMHSSIFSSPLNVLENDIKMIRITDTNEWREREAMVMQWKVCILKRLHIFYKRTIIIKQQTSRQGTFSKCFQFVK